MLDRPSWHSRSIELDRAFWAASNEIRQVQRFLSAHDQVANIFPRRRDHDTAANLRSGRTQAFATWAGVTGVAMAA